MKQGAESVDVLVMGGGAAGMFAAIHAAAGNTRVLLLEKSARFLSKVLISGGGRCNLTHECSSPAQLMRHYPRGGKFLKPLFTHFQVADTINWFHERGVETKTEADGRMFPVSDDAADVARALLDAARERKVELRSSCGVKSIVPCKDHFLVTTEQGLEIYAAKVIVAPGGLPKASQYAFLDAFTLQIIEPVPSLFTFHIQDKALQALSGVSVPEAIVRVEGHPETFKGPLLITHWGLSGPAILRCSAWMARELYQKDYTFNLSVNWLGNSPQLQMQQLHTQTAFHPKKQINNCGATEMPQRLWEYLLEQSGIEPQQACASLGKKAINRLCENLCNLRLSVKGKSMFKEEFVTAGGVDLSEINGLRMESKRWPGLHFAGEVLDIDGITGGFNFQSAWTTGYIAGTSAAEGLA